MTICTTPRSVSENSDVSELVGCSALMEIAPARSYRSRAAMALSVRFYLFADDGVYRISQQLMQRLPWS